MSSLICLYLLKQSKVSGNRGTKHKMMGRSLWGKDLHWGRCCTFDFFLLFGGPNVQVPKEQLLLKVPLIVKMSSKNMPFLRKSFDTPSIFLHFLTYFQLFVYQIAPFCSLNPEQSLWLGTKRGHYRSLKQLEIASRNIILASDSSGKTSEVSDSC